MQSRKSQFEARDVTVIIISFAEPARLLPYQNIHHWPFIMLADPERLAYRAFSLKRLTWFRVFSPQTLKLYMKLLREGKKLQNYGRDDIYQAGGDFLVDREGRILYAHRSIDPSDRPTAESLLNTIEPFLTDADDTAGS